MRRIILGLALALLAFGPPSQVRAGDAEDRQAAQEIAAILRDSGRIHNYNVGIKYKQGTVWLEGHVSSQEQMDEVLMQVGDLDEVTQIVNNLTIGAPAPVQKGKSSRRVPITRGVPETQLASMQRPVNRGTPLGMATANGAPSPAYYQQAAAQMGQDPASCPPGQMQGQMQGQMGGPGGPGMMQGQMGGPGAGNRPLPAYTPGPNGSPPPAAYDQPYMPNYAWPSYAAYPNYAAVTYPKQYSASAWPYIGPFHPYPQVPLGWRKVSLEWDDGWWFLDFDDRGCH
ncbi:MAG TPA: BON domain-containing protein [Pirellulales bacterium]|jgi:hypothetical protein|nr:BON domain-containing protein [Pirellulales bacterium]